MLPSKIILAIEQPPISQLVKVVGQEAICLQIEFELIKLASLHNTGGNLSPVQAKFISEQLFDLYPNETIADFKICFQRGSVGFYGPIQRLDGVTIGIWFKKYLEEKYEVLEKKLLDEKDEFKKMYEPQSGSVDWLEVWKKSIESTENKYRTSISTMTREEIVREGREEPVKEKPYPTASIEEVIKQDLHIQYIRENYDARTGYKVDEWISEDDWLNTESAKNLKVDLKNHYAKTMLKHDDKP